ncbi:MAG: hypothetical protein JXA54_14380 [Candidatus Heimdallarchaeota archaeon]|nr:hypothetical protein [Candidatus Heimdallarchaeota archaeon]
MSEEEPPKIPEVDEPTTNNAEMESLKKSLDEKVGEISQLKEKIAALETELKSKEDELNLLKEETKAFQATDSDNKQTIKDLEHRLSQKELEITRLEGSVEDLGIAKKKIEDLQKEHKALEERMRAFKKIAENEPRFKILNNLEEFGEMRINQLAMQAGVAPSQAKIWLEELERAGLLVIHGEGRDSNPLVSSKKK